MACCEYSVIMTGAFTPAASSAASCMLHAQAVSLQCAGSTGVCAPCVHVLVSRYPYPGASGTSNQSPNQRSADFRQSAGVIETNGAPNFMRRDHQAIDRIHAIEQICRRGSVCDILAGEADERHVCGLARGCHVSSAHSSHSQVNGHRHRLGNGIDSSIDRPACVIQIASQGRRLVCRPFSGRPAVCCRPSCLRQPQPSGVFHGRSQILRPGPLWQRWL